MIEPSVPCPIFSPYQHWNPYSDNFPENRYARDYLNTIDPACKPFSNAQFCASYLRSIAPSWRLGQMDFNVATHSLESMLNWSFLHGISLLSWTDQQFIEYIHFRLNPPDAWIGSKACPRFISNPALPFSEWKPSERWRPFQMRIESADGTAPVNVTRIIRRIYDSSVSFFNFCNFSSWILRPKAISFTSKSICEIYTKLDETESLTNHEMNWIFTFVAGTEARHLRPQAVIAYIAFARYTKLKITEILGTPEAPRNLSQFYKGEDGTWASRFDTETVGKIKITREFTRFFEDYLNCLGVDKAGPMPVVPIFPKNNGLQNYTALMLAKHLALFRNLLGDAAKNSPDPLISRAENKFRKITFPMIRRNYQFSDVS